MTTLQDVGIIVFPSPRARAYLQALMKAEYHPAYAVLVDRVYEPEIKVSDSIKKSFFDIERTEKETLRKMGVEYASLNAKDINDKSIYDAIKDCPQRMFIYTGGGIVGNKLLSLKKLIHIHPGIVPAYRGSTCFYYSIIKEGTIGMSAMFLSEDIDEGSVLGGRIYDVIEGVDIDYILDPYLRSQFLVEVLTSYVDENGFNPTMQSPNGGETYYIIHPVLKHIAILKANLRGCRNNGR
ncbi:MAG: hypothetical protein B6U72_07240 [Candidatus Altiarchaeales archaeon ex4484_2]|nr:MAG: hypothetical protein B6U72_07240 [Candidatus Altiarchaeales archaeon ex4484_2]